MNRQLPINGYPTDPKKLRVHNFIKYKATPPSWSLIESVLEESGIRGMYKFELIFGIVQQSLKLYKNGHRCLPVIYWHIFYDFETVRNNKNKVYKKIKGTKKHTKTDTILDTNKHILHGIRQESIGAG